jgi:hypothetical protein
MKKVNIKIKGIVPLLQNRFVGEIEENSSQRSGVVDYSEDWKEALYFDEKLGVYEPSEHILGAMIQAAKNFQIPGRGKKTYKDLMKSAIIIEPDKIALSKKEPDEIDKRPVVIRGSRILRQRPMMKEGWELSFTVNILDEQLPVEVVKRILEHSGRYIGIGDYRPRFGRFTIEEFEEIE